MVRFGFVDPLVVDEKSGKLVAGHGRLEALQKLKRDGKPAPARVQEENGDWLVPVLVGISFASEKEAEAYLIADNQSVIMGGWDESTLQALLKDHTEDLSGIGFTPTEIEALRMPELEPVDRTDPKSEKELHVNWMHPPDVERWLDKMKLGKTLNVCCGMSKVGDVRIDTDAKTNRTEAGDVMKLTFKPGSFDTVICDPPFSYYNHFKWLQRLGDIAKKRMLISGPTIALNNFLPRFKAELYALTASGGQGPMFLRLYWVFDRKR